MDTMALFLLTDKQRAWLEINCVPVCCVVPTNYMSQHDPWVQEMNI